MKLLKYVLMLNLIFISSASFAKASDEARTTIVGGEEAIPGEFPFMVSLRGFFGGHFCGASLIKKNWVLTAAHCVKGATVWSVALGLHEKKRNSQTERISVKNVIVHPEYSSRNMDYDFALLELAEDSIHEPVALNTTEVEISEEEGSEPMMAVVAGWGASYEDDYWPPSALQKVSVPLISQAQCNESYLDTITDRMMCAGYPEGGKDSCQGDSGGPLVMADENGQPVLVGVVSWGKGCGRKGYPGVYSKVNSVSTWIEQTAR